jgi:ankyrin repeat protein
MKYLAIKDCISAASYMLTLSITVAVTLISLQGCLSKGYYDRESISPQDKFFAAMQSHEWARADAIIDEGLNIDFVGDGKENTPLMIWSQFGNDKAVIYLLSKGADINRVDSNGFSALSFAAKYGQESTVELLISRGADINLVTKRFGQLVAGGQSLLMIAAEHERGGVVNILLSHGVDVNLIDGTGMNTAMDVALTRQAEIASEIAKSPSVDSLRWLKKSEAAIGRIIETLRAHGAKTAAELSAEK